jgi:endo-1,4-beta-xylanase
MDTTRRSFLGTAGAAVAAALGGCLRHSVQVSGGLPAAVRGLESLRAEAAPRGLLYGCAVDTGLLGRDEGYTALIRQQAAVVVAENSMKMGPMRPSPNQFDFSGGDKLVAFADASGMKVRGHNLCWHRQLPRWFEGYASKENARSLLVDHIRTVALHYAGRIQSWDVVNEAVAVEDGRSDGLRESPWLKLVGPEYVELAFETARAADPKARLTYNDYGIEAEDDGSARKRAAVLALIRRLKSKGLIDAVGIQSHIGVNQRFGSGLSDFMAAVAAMGLEIDITELDVNDRALPADVAGRDRAVAAAYGDYLRFVLHNKNVRSVLTWGITDAHTWLNGEDARADHMPERCLPFDAELKPVEAFYAIGRSLREAPARG